MFNPHSPAAPLSLWQGKVQAEWLDYNGHMTEHRYLQVAGESSDAFLQVIGINLQDTRQTGAYFTLQSHMTHKAECKRDEALQSSTELLAYDAKRVHLYHRIHKADGTLAAASEILMLHMRDDAVAEALPATQAALAQIFQWQAALPLPEAVGSVLTKPLLNNRYAA